MLLENHDKLLLKQIMKCFYEDGWETDLQIISNRKNIRQGLNIKLKWFFKENESITVGATTYEKGEMFQKYIS